MRTRTDRLSLALFALSTLAAFLAASCSTLPADIQYSTELTTQYTALQDLAVKVTAARLSPDSKKLPALAAEIQAGIKNAQSESALLASLYALLGQVQVLSGEIKNAGTSLQKSRAFSAGNEDAYILEAMLEKDSDKKIAILEKAVVKADTIQRVRAELAMTFFYAGKYNEAIAQFDTSLPYLPEAFAELYLPFRNKAQEYKEAGIKPMQVIADTFTVDKMISIIHTETALLAWFTGPGKWESGVLFERMKGSGWFPENPLTPNGAVRRKDAALVFWYILTRGNSVMLRKYTEKYKTKTEGPIADVPYGSPWFDAVVGVVEEDIMQLTEGKFFNPDALLSELDFRKMLKLLAASV